MYEKLDENITDGFEVEVSLIGKYRTYQVDSEVITEIASTLKNEGFNHLSDVTVVDYLKQGEFEVIYHLWSYGKKQRVIVKTRLSREDPVIKTLTPLWTSAHMHERENHEMFGVVFDGHTQLTPLLLEDWKGMPPLKKDFDSRQFVLDTFYGGERE